MKRIIYRVQRGNATRKEERGWATLILAPLLLLDRNDLMKNVVSSFTIPTLEFECLLHSRSERREIMSKQESRSSTPNSLFPLAKVAEVLC